MLVGWLADNVKFASGQRSCCQKCRLLKLAINVLRRAETRSNVFSCIQTLFIRAGKNTQSIEKQANPDCILACEQQVKVCCNTELKYHNQT
jgi:hypothetical protein